MSTDPADKNGAAERRDAVLRRMLATPKPGKAEKAGGPKSARKAPAAKQKRAKAPS